MSDYWVTKEEEEQIMKEFRYLNSIDPIQIIGVICNGWILVQMF